MKTINQIWDKLKDVELVQVRPVEMESLYKRCFEFEKPTILEIGSAHGASSIVLAEAATELGGRLICIDSFPENYYEQEKFGDYARKAFKKNLKPYKNVTLIDKDSKKAVKDVVDLVHEWAVEVDVPDGKGGTQKAIDNFPGLISILFIDGDHSYEGVSEDIKNYLHWVKQGGYVGFHDYNNVAFEGVKRAVSEHLDELEEIGSYWDLRLFKKR